MTGPRTGPIRYLFGLLPKALRVLGWIVLGYAVLTAVLFGSVYGQNYFRSPPPQAAATFDAFRAGSVYVAPGARRWVDVPAAEHAIGNRPILVAVYDRALPNGVNDDYAVCRAVAREFGEVLVVLLQPGADVYACVGDGWPAAAVPAGEQTFGLDSPSVWANDLSATVSASTWLATADGDQTPLITELAAQYDVFAHARLAGMPPDRVLTEAHRTWKIIGWLALVVVLVLGLFLGLRWAGRRALAARRRRDRLAGLRAATQAKVYRLAAEVRDGSRSTGLAEASERYLDVLGRLDTARTPADFTRIDTMIDEAEALATRS
jgi:hypothetical protein